MTLTLTIGVALPAVGASPTGLVKKALKLAKGANKRSKVALLEARKRVAGPAGPQGSAGPAGPAQPPRHRQGSPRHP
jgi:hypothetical protein